MIKRLRIYKPTKTTRRRKPIVSVGIPCQEINCVTEATCMADIGLYSETFDEEKNAFYMSRRRFGLRFYGIRFYDESSFRYYILAYLFDCSLNEGLRINNQFYMWRNTHQ